MKKIKVITIILAVVAMLAFEACSHRFCAGMRNYNNDRRIGLAR
jgi:hypothetical protein